MRQTAFFLLMLCAIINGYAQSRYILSGVFPDGKILNDYDVLFLNDSCILNVTNQEGVIQPVKSCQWEFNVLKSDYIYYETIRESQEVSFKIAIDSLLYKNEVRYEFCRYSFESSNSVFYSASIHFEGELASGEVIRLRKPILLNLLPSRPQFKVLDFKYSFYDSKHLFFEDGELTVQLIADRCDRGFVTQGFTTSPGGGIISFYLPFNIDPVNQIASFECVYSDAFFVFTASNENGGSRGRDTLWMDTYIPTSAENILIGESISFFPNPAKDILNIKGDLENITSIRILNCSGQLVKQISCITPTIDISDLPNGIYLISYVDRVSQKKMVYKLLKT